jgi:hypothetical protein
LAPGRVYDLALFKDVSPQSDEIVDVSALSRFPGQRSVGILESRGRDRPEFRIRHLYHREGRPLGPWETCLGHPPVNDRLGRCVYDLALFKDVSPQSDEIVDVSALSRFPGHVPRARPDPRGVGNPVSSLHATSVLGANTSSGEYWRNSRPEHSWSHRQ